MNADEKKVRKAGRRRRAAGWTLLVFGVLVAAVLVWSGWGEINYGWSESYLTVSRGVVRCITPEKRNTLLYLSGWSSGIVRQQSPQWEWADGRDEQMVSFIRMRKTIGVAWYQRDVGLFQTVGVVLWPVPFLLGTFAALLLRSGIRAKQRAVTNACAKCGYSLAGLEAGASCPECGKANGAR